jgi:hypothetical protein
MIREYLISLSTMGQILQLPSCPVGPQALAGMPVAGGKSPGGPDIFPPAGAAPAVERPGWR